MRAYSTRNTSIYLEPHRWINGIGIYMMSEGSNIFKAMLSKESYMGVGLKTFDGIRFNFDTIAEANETLQELGRLNNLTIK